jgi:hypothetical protein
MPHLEDIVIENNMLESALRKLKELKEKEKNKKIKTLDQKINFVLGDNNNHILFDLWLRSELSSYKDEDKDKKIRETIYAIFSNEKYNNKIQNFAKINTYVATTLENYNNAIKKVKEEQEKEEKRSKEVE